MITSHDVLEPLKQVLSASRDVIVSGQICGSKLQKVFTLGDRCWLTMVAPLCVFAAQGMKRFVRSQKFEYLASVFIIANTAYTAYAADYMARHETDKTPSSIRFVEERRDCETVASE